MADYPESYSYTREHEWIAVEGDVGTVGVTHHAQDELGDVVFVELPEPGTECRQEEPFGTIESVKAVSDLYAPVSGEIVGVNEELAERPEIVNQDPHGAGWMVKIKLSNPAELERLMSATEYQDFIRE